MKKKTLKCLALTAVCALGAVSFAACNNNGEGEATPVQSAYAVNEGLLAEDYIDYADTVQLDIETYPQIADMGLTIVTGYGENDFDDVREADADGIDEATGKSNMELYFDSSRPSIVIIHGVQFNGGRRGRCHMGTENRDEEVASGLYSAENDIDYLKTNSAFNEDHDLSKYWYDGACGQQAYNVFFFHYERFADMVGAGESSIVNDAAYPGTVVDHIWSADNGVQAIYLNEQNNYVMTEKGKALGGYSVAELYAAEYIRAFGQIETLYPEYKNSGLSTYVASHSMGGVVSVAGNMLLKLLADDGQIDINLTPSRLLQMDSFVGMPMNNDAESTISWSGKNYLSNGEESQNACQNYLYSVEALALKYNVAVDFYMNKGVGVPFTCMVSWDKNDNCFAGYRSEEANRILAVSAMIQLSPYFAGVNDAAFGEGHNAIREWVLSSYLYSAPKATDADGNEYTVITARATNAESIAARGTYVEMIGKTGEGEFVAKSAKGNYPDGARYAETVRCDDDAFDKLK